MGLTFSLVANIAPDHDSEGRIVELVPQHKYQNVRRLSLNRHGNGPFCRFRAAERLPYEGVYAVTVDGTVVYVGECQSLSERFGQRGYGMIHPRNCFERGQSTNCRINHLILDSAKRGGNIDLWFHRSSDRKGIEDRLIAALTPPWNSRRRAAARSQLETIQDSAVGRSGDPMPRFILTLEKTFYLQGFFNVTVAFDRFVRPSEGPVELVLGESGRKITGKINRTANRNGMARIMGGSELRDWFQMTHHLGDLIDVDLSSTDTIRIS